MDYTFWRQCMLLMGITAVIITVTMLVGPGCATDPGIKVEVKAWAGDSANAAVTRSQDKKSIACTDPAFDDMICMTYEDLKNLYLSLRKCKEWTQ